MKTALNILFCLLAIQVVGQLPAFPTAYGAGAYTTGGRGGNVYHVTNLNNTGTGSFRWALSQTRPATIVFDVSGTIELTSNLTITGNNLTIAGQSAPQGGITITSSNFSRFRMQEANNVIIRYIRSRIQASPSDYDTFEIYANTGVGSNIILDHMSLSYGGDECFDVRGTDTFNVTFQRGLIAEGKTGVLFGDTDQEQYSYNNSFLTTLFFKISHRTPNASSDGRVDVLNNVVYDWRQRTTFLDGDTESNVMNNYFVLKGLGSWTAGKYRMFQANSSQAHQIYTSGNIIEGVFTDTEADNRGLWAEFALGTSQNLLPLTEFTGTQYSLLGRGQLMTAAEAFTSVVEDSGANKYLNADGTFGWYHDANDADYLEHIENGTSESYANDSGGPYNNGTWFEESRYSNFRNSISSTPINTRPGNYYDSNPHIPEIWFQANVPEGDDHNDLAPSGYTWLEEFLNQVDGEQEPPEEIAVTALTWNNDTQTVGMGGFLNLSHTFTPSNATDKGFSIVSSDTGVVSHTGAVIGAGTATLTITANDTTNGTISDVMNVTVNAAPEPSGPSGKINKGQFFIIDN